MSTETVNHLRSCGAAPGVVQIDVEYTASNNNANANEQVPRVCVVARNANIMGTIPSWLHSNGRTLRALNYDTDKLWNIDPSALTSPPFVTLEKVDSWKKVYWSDNNVAIAKPLFSVNRSIGSGPQGYTTAIYDTDSGIKIAQEENSQLLPIGWLDQNLLMGGVNHKNDYRVMNLYSWDYFNYAWDVFNEGSKPQEIFSFTDRWVAEVACRRSHAFSLTHFSPQPFARLDLQTQHLSNMSYILDPLSANRITNFDVTDIGNLYFTKDRSFILLHGQTSEVMTHIELPIIPEKLTYQWPFMACYRESEFCVYDVRRTDQLIHYQNYLTLGRQIKQAFNVGSYLTSIFYDVFYDTKIRSMAFHGNSLFIGKGDNIIEGFDLVACSPFSLTYLKSKLYG